MGDGVEHLMARRDKQPAPIVCLSGGALRPVSSYDAQELAAYPVGTEFDLVARTKRSQPQLRMYWAILAQAVAATGRWPTREKLHNALKFDLGRVEPVYNTKGHIVSMTPDSIALDSMPPIEFQAYFNEAMALLSEVLGYDPLENLGAA